MKTKHQLVGLLLASAFGLGSDLYAACPDVSGTYVCENENFEIAQNDVQGKTVFVASGIKHIEEQLSLSNGAWSYMSSYAKCTPETVNLYFGLGFSFVAETVLTLKGKNVTMTRWSAPVNVENNDFSIEEEKFMKSLEVKYGEQGPSEKQRDDDYRKLILEVGAPYWEKFKKDGKAETVVCTKQNEEV
ncbi:MAG: hypothetical protein HYX41_01860 [Bdellovibrio sp.]|nr:hypothetical protein [Bdellovibrio sp.]